MWDSKLLLMTKLWFFCQSEFRRSFKLVQFFLTIFSYESPTPLEMRFWWHIESTCVSVSLLKRLKRRMTMKIYHTERKVKTRQIFSTFKSRSFMSADWLTDSLHIQLALVSQNTQRLPELNREANDYKLLTASRWLGGQAMQRMRMRIKSSREMGRSRHNINLRALKWQLRREAKVSLAGSRRRPVLLAAHRKELCFMRILCCCRCSFVMKYTTQLSYMV